MEKIIALSIVLSAVLFLIVGILLLFSPELLIRINDRFLNTSKKKINLKDIFSFDVFIFARRFIFGLLLILLSLYLIYTIGILF